MNANNRIIIMGHRGANKIAPENTLKAFKEAIRLGADYVEFDVQETINGEIVIIHDYNTLRTAGIEGIVKQMTLKELKKLNFGNGERIPTLLELIDLAKNKISLNCEIKAEAIAKTIIQIFQDADILDSTIISSFLHEELVKIQKIEPQLKLATLVPTEAEKFSDWTYKKKLIDYTSENNYYAINPLYKLADRQFIEYAHEKNVKVFPWTVDSGIAMRKLINSGTDGIITNDISRLKEVLNGII